MHQGFSPLDAFWIGSGGLTLLGVPVVNLILILALVLGGVRVVMALMDLQQKIKERRRNV